MEGNGGDGKFGLLDEILALDMPLDAAFHWVPASVTNAFPVDDSTVRRLRRLGFNIPRRQRSLLRSDDK